MLLAEQKMEEIERKKEKWQVGTRWDHFQEGAGAMLNAILWDFHWGRKYSRGMWDVRNPSNTKSRCRNHLTSPENGENMKNQWHPNASCWTEDGRNREKERNMTGWDTLGPLPGGSWREPCWTPFCGISTGEESIPGVCEMSGTPRIQKVAAATTQPAQKLEKTWRINDIQMLLAEQKMEEIEREKEKWQVGTRWDHFQEGAGAMLNAILWDFHWGRKYSRGMWDVRNPSNTKSRCRNHLTSPENGENMKNQWHPNASCWTEDGRNREKERKMTGWDTLGPLPGGSWSHVERHSVGFPLGKKVFQGYVRCPEPLEYKK